MDSQLEKTHGTLLLYMITAVKLYAKLYVQKWKYSEIPTPEEWLMKTEMAKLTC